MKEVSLFLDQRLKKKKNVVLQNGWYSHEVGLSTSDSLYNIHVMPTNANTHADVNSVGPASTVSFVSWFGLAIRCKAGKQTDG